VSIQTHPTANQTANRVISHDRQRSPQWRHSKKLLGSFLLVVAALGCWSQPAEAEGSRELTGSGGDRPYLEYRNDKSAGIDRRTTIYVYANSGETINLGSSAAGIGSGTINYRRPNGTTGTCGTAGLIANRNEEVNGTFTPCPVTVASGQSGIWRIEFISPDPTSTTDPPPLLATANWSQPNTVGYVSAWDVTVRNSSGTAILGRVFTDYFALNVGGNGSARSLSPQFWILTKDGYQYRIDLNGMDPFGFIFFANNRGFRNSSGNAIYRSLQFLPSGTSGNMPPDYSFHSPIAPDTATDVTHRIFINPPDPLLPRSAIGLGWLSAPEAPPVPSSFTFTGVEGTPGRAGTTPLGGNFVFSAARVGSYSIMLDINRDGVFGNGNDRIIVGTTISGTNTVFWDGRDGDGAIVPASAVAYNADVVLYAGEAHFPFFDPENNLNGIIVERVNNPSPPTTPLPDPYLIYYDDRNTGNSADRSLCAAGEGSGCYGTPPSPRSALAGVNSQTGAHRFSNNFGDRRGIDTWVYYPSQPVRLNGGILVQAADLSIAKTDGRTTIAPGMAITYTVTVTNSGPSNVANARVLDTVPNTITGVNWSCAIATGTGSCGAANGSGNTINTAVSLNSGAVATYTITGTVSPTASGTLNNTAEVRRNNDQTDPNPGNNTATDTTDIVRFPIDLSIAKTDNQTSTTPGSPINYTITVTNLGSQAVTSMRVTDTVPAAIQNPVFTPSAGTYNSSTGDWTGLNLATGQSVTLTLSGTVSSTATGTITNTATVAPSGGGTDGNPANNSATDNTAIAASPSLILVKRITAVNDTNITSVVDDPSSTNDNAPNWLSPTDPTTGISTYLRGAIDGGTVRPGDTIEYTIYFLSNGTAPVTNVNLCDLVPANTTFIPNSFSSTPESGIALSIGTTTTNLTNVPDADGGEYFVPGAVPTVTCSAANTNGSVVVRIVQSPMTLPNASAPGTPNSYGFIRFRARVINSTN